MSCSRSSSSRRRPGALAAALAVAGLLAGCAHRGVRSDPIPRPRIVLLPVENLSARPAPLREIYTAIEVALRRKFEVVGGDILEQFLSRHRLRFTGGVDEAVAVAAREELGADAILITSLLTFRGGEPPVVGIAMRLVTASEQPTILWMDQHAFAGDESPGLLALGLVSTFKGALDPVVARLARSLDLAMDGKAPAPDCGGGGRYRPKVRFASRIPERDGHVLAVLPFLNWSNRRNAGEVVSLEFLRQLVASGDFHVLEPGVVRQFMLRSRMMMPSGVSLETTRLLVGALEADLVLAGTVIEYGETFGATGPTVRFNSTVLDGHTGEVVWHSGSYNKGDDGVFAFGLGRVATPGKLLCRMVRPVVAEMTRGERRVGGAVDLRGRLDRRADARSAGSAGGEVGRP